MVWDPHLWSHMCLRRLTGSNPARTLTGFSFYHTDSVSPFRLFQYRTKTCRRWSAHYFLNKTYRREIMKRKATLKKKLHRTCRGVVNKAWLCGLKNVQLGIAFSFCLYSPCVHLHSWEKSCLKLHRSFTYSNFVCHVNLESSSSVSQEENEGKHLVFTTA